MITEDDMKAFDDSCSYWNKPYVTYATPLDMVSYFAKISDQTPDPLLYYKLMEEEYKEVREAVCPLEELKELADLVYVCYGYALANGWDLNAALYRVHLNNVGRIRQPDGTIKRREDGKIIKNPDYPKVDLTDLIEPKD